MNLKRPRKRAGTLPAQVPVDDVAAPYGVASPRSEGTSIVVEMIPRPHRASDVLARQPLSLQGLSPLERNLVLVASVVDDHGREHVVSRVGDQVWDLRSWDWPPNIEAWKKRIDWPDDLPPALLEDAQNACYAWIKRGKPGGQPASATTFTETVRRAMTTLRFLAARGVMRFDQVTKIDIADLHGYLKQGRSEKDLSEGPLAIRAPATIRQYMEIVNLIWVFPGDVKNPLKIDPWDGMSLAKFSGSRRSNGVGKTDVMPRRVVESIFTYCEMVLDRAPRLLDLWEAGRWSEAVKLLGLGDPDSLACSLWKTVLGKVCEIRDAVLFMLEISTGMRNSEAIGLKSGCWRAEVDKNSGVLLHWVTTAERKTGKGLCDFLAPPELFPALEVLQRWAKPYQEEMRRQIVRLEGLLSATNGDVFPGPQGRATTLLQLADAREHVSSLFFVVDSSDQVSSINHVMSFDACNEALARLAKAAHADWIPRNHECRRTYAWTIANSRIGRFALVFLKWQLKHSTMSVTQLYASNPHQDQDLYEEIYEATVKAQAEVLFECFEEGEGVAGGFGATLNQLRERELRGIAVKDKKALILHTAQTETLRNNGHAYCMAKRRGCGGNGLFDAGWCVDCDESLIKSREHFAFWWNWLILSRKLFDVKDCGQAARERAEKDIRYAEKVFTDFGHPLPSADADFIDYQEPFAK